MNIKPTTWIWGIYHLSYWDFFEFQWNRFSFCSKKSQKRVKIQWKWKEPSTVILLCFWSQSQIWPFSFLFESHNSMKMRRTFIKLSFCLWFYSETQIAPFIDLFESCKFNENEKNFQMSCWLFFHTCFWKLQIWNSMKRRSTFNCDFDFVFTAQASLALLVIFFESRKWIQWK